jgi:hypothetical protein
MVAKVRITRIPACAVIAYLITPQGLARIRMVKKVTPDGSGCRALTVILAPLAKALPSL